MFLICGYSDQSGDPFRAFRLDFRTDRKFQVDRSSPVAPPPHPAPSPKPRPPPTLHPHGTHFHVHSFRNCIGFSPTHTHTYTHGKKTCFKKKKNPKLSCVCFFGVGGRDETSVPVDLKFLAANFLFYWISFRLAPLLGSCVCAGVCGCVSFLNASLLNQPIAVHLFSMSPTFLFYIFWFFIPFDCIALRVHPPT